MYSSTLDAVRSIWKEEGARGFFKGFGTATLNLAVGQIYISIFEKLRSGDIALLNGSSETMRTPIAACAAVLVSQLVGNPVDVVSQRLMVDRAQHKPRGFRLWGKPFEVASALYAREGVKGFYRGFWASVVQMAPGSSIWWTSYSLYRRAGQAMLGPTPADHHHRAVEMISGALAGTTVAVLVNPLDVIRTRVQVNGTPLLATTRAILLEEGLRGLTAGMLARVWTLAPNGVLIMSAYELTKRLSLSDEAKSRRMQTDSSNRA
jgi:solute carrier family 25, member 44